MPAPSLLSTLPRGDPERKPEKFSPPAAMFAKPATVRALEWKPGKIFLGVVDGTIEKDKDGRPYVAGGRPVGVAEDRHMMTVAGSRAGKGRAAIIPNMLHYPGSVLATDPKGELATITARQRKEGLGQAVHVLDPFGVAVGYPHDKNSLSGFNPIEAMRAGRHLVEDGALIADALVVVAGKDPHWDESAKALIEGVILHVKTWPDYEGRRNLLTVREQVGGDEATLDRLDGRYADRTTAAGGVIQSAAADFFDRKGNEKASVLSSARRHLKFIDLFRDKANPLGRLTLERTISNCTASRQPRQRFICACLPGISARATGGCACSSTHVAGHGNAAKKGQTLPGGVPVLCVLDEFAALGHMQQIEAAAGQIAGFGVKLWPILQDLAQLKALYETRWETFMGNAGIVQFFGNNDLTTLEWISKRSAKPRSRRRGRVTSRQGR